MSYQTYLTENPPMILDATCSYARIWPAHATIRIDIRPETKPDKVMDNANTDFPDHYFDEIYYDPPHVIRRSQDRAWIQDHFERDRRRTGRTSPGFFERFGWWESKQVFLNNIDGVNKEFYRILKESGQLRIKISFEVGHKTRCITKDDFFSRMTNFRTIKDCITKSKSNLGKNEVHWLTMRPKP